LISKEETKREKSLMSLYEGGSLQKKSKGKGPERLQQGRRGKKVSRIETARDRRENGLGARTMREVTRRGW